MKKNSSHQTDMTSTNLSDLNKQIISKAAIYIRQTIAQRKLANMKIMEDKNINCDAILTTLQTELIQTIIVDYYQNKNLSHLGSKQPSDDYYFSPLSIYTFGILNSVTSHLDAYIYNEFGGS